jgi:hypothetical protein
VAHSTRAADSQKQRKPHKTSDTLTARSDGRWCKQYKSNGVWKSFYTRGTEQEALDEWGRVKADLLTGREPPPLAGYVSIADLVNNFLHHKKLKLDSREVAQISWNKAERTDNRPPALGVCSLCWCQSDRPRLTRQSHLIFRHYCTWLV